MNNVQGYLKYGRQIWGEALAEPLPPPSTRALEPVEPIEEVEEVTELVDDDALEEIEAFVEENYASGGF